MRPIAGGGRCEACCAAAGAAGADCARAELSCPLQELGLAYGTLLGVSGVMNSIAEAGSY